MRALIQRVSKAEVVVNKAVISKINQGLLILLAVTTTDTIKDVSKLTSKIPKLRIFSDADDKMNLSAIDTEASALVVSQFTLYSDAKKGNRPSYAKAAEPSHANELYEAFIESLSTHMAVESGIFGANMQVELINDGPVTIMLDTKDL